MARNLGTRRHFHLSAMLLGLLLSGCALPMPVQMASWALDGISFITTRKSLVDHGLSLIARQDCAIWRGIAGGVVCITDDAGIIAIASASEKVGIARSASAIASPSIANPIDPGPLFPDDVGGIETFKTASGVAEPDLRETGSVQLNYQTPGTIVPPPPPSSVKTKKPGKVADRFYLIGQFQRVSKAKRMAGRYAWLGPEVIEIKDGYRRVFKVVVGPFSSDHQDQVKGHILRSGIKNVRVAHVDGSERFVARYYSIATYNGKTSTPKIASNIHIDMAKAAPFTRYKKALMYFFGV